MKPCSLSPSCDTYRNQNQDIIKKIVSLEFGKFLAYYADAPEISQVSTAKEKREKGSKAEKGKKGATPTSEGYRKLFINLGKKDGFYPGEIMQFLNKHVHGHVQVGHIDLLTTMSYFEVPEEDAERVIKYVNGQRYKNRDVRCNDASEGKTSTRKTSKTRDTSKTSNTSKTYKKEEWMQFLNPKGMKLKGEIPNFEEEGWAIRKPRKKK